MPAYFGTCMDVTEHKRQTWRGQRVRQSLLRGQAVRAHMFGQ